MRNNQRRTGSQTRPQPAAASQANLAYVVPTEFVELPSRGVFYPEGHPFFNQETVEIKFMTAKDEDILSSQALIKKGIMIERLLESLIVEDVDPNSLLLADKTAIMMAARISSYGSEYDATASCTACTNRNEFVYDLKNASITGNCFDEKYLHENSIVLNEESKTFDVELPISKVKVSISPITGKEEKKYLDDDSENRTNTITGMLATFIVAVNDDTNYGQIINFVENMPAGDSKFLRDIYSSLTPKVELLESIVCSACFKSQIVEVPLTAEFFWPR